MNMKSFFLVVSLVFILPAIALAESWNQLLTVVVETPAGDVQASSISSVDITPPSEFFKGDVGNATILTFGEAFFVQITKRRRLFVLVDGMEYWAMSALRAQGAKGSMAKVASAFANFNEVIPLNVGGSRRYHSYPTLIVFDDENRPETARIIPPANLAAEFGTGVHLKAMLIQRTNQPVAKGEIYRTLTWLSGFSANRLCGADRESEEIPDCRRIKLFDLITYNLHRELTK
ncbi:MULTISPECIES: hypothetical protein [unclassified Roseovarius]|uniref:hypothetical protein n=1 Tax=unclassified Roseovarius TaxID=2614913 RepID=UPI00273F7402|nr:MULTISPECIES: hypothetical protein [unclassified Roseovarius]